MQRTLIQELDISEQLRSILAEKRMTVAELASAAGVSKSAMEKYLQGPSSPRATAIVNMCVNLGVSPERILFGGVDRNSISNMSLITSHMFQIIYDLKKPGEIRDTFENSELESREFITFALSLASARLEGIGEELDQLKRDLIRAAAAVAREKLASRSPEPPPER